MVADKFSLNSRSTYSCVVHLRALGCRVVHNALRARIIVASHGVQGDERLSIGVVSVASTTVSEWLHNAKHLSQSHLTIF